MLTHSQARAVFYAAFEPYYARPFNMQLVRLSPNAPTWVVDAVDDAILDYFLDQDPEGDE